MSKIRLLKGGSIQPAFDKNGLSHQTDDGECECGSKAV